MDTIYIRIYAAPNRGRKFQREGTYEPSKEFAFGMCAGPLTSALAKPSFLCAPAFTRIVWWWYFGGCWLWCVGGGDVMWCAVLWWCDAMGWDGMLCGCGSLWLCDACWLWGHVMWCDVLVWRGELVDDVLWTTESPYHSTTTPKYKALLSTTM